MEDVETILKDAFGESSSSENDGEKHEESHQNPTWKRISEIKGLFLCPDFLSPKQQSRLLSQIQKEGWFTESSCNQAMRFGDLPGWAVELSSSIYEVILSDIAASEDDSSVCLFPSELLWREPLFDQLIVNKYEPGEGICSHVDLMRFEDGIAIISLDSSCIMQFSQVQTGEQDCEENQERFPPRKVPLYLTPGSLVLMSGEARYLWKHGIDRRPGLQIWEGEEIEQRSRISITLRRLRQNTSP